MTKRIDIRVPDDIAEWFDGLRAALGGARGAQVLAMIRAKIPDAAALLQGHGVLTEHSRTVPPDSVSAHGESRHAHGVVTDPGVPPRSRSAHGVLTESPAMLTEHSVSSPALRGCDSRAAVPAYFSAEEEREEKRERSLPLETKEVGEGTGRGRAVTAEWIVSRWNAWAAKRRGDGFDPKHVDLEREQPSRGYVTGLVRQIHQQRQEHPSLDDWRRALDALDALPDHAARMLRLDGPDKLFGWATNDPMQRPRLWRIADGDWSTWTGPSVAAAPVQIATTMPRHHTYESRGEDEMAPPVWEWTAGATREECDAIFCAWLDECERLGKDPTTRTLPENVARRSPLRPDEEWLGAMRIADAY